MAISVEESIEIDAPPERVWDLVMDPERHGEWVTAHREARDVPDGELAEGDGYRQVLCLAGKRFEVAWKLVERDEPALAVWRGEGPRGTSAAVRYELASANGGGGTRFDYRNELELPKGPFGAIARRAAGGPARRQARKSLRLLKRALES